MDVLPGMVAEQVERAKRIEDEYFRTAAAAGVDEDHAQHLLKFATRQIADGKTTVLDPYQLAASWIRRD